MKSTLYVADATLAVVANTVSQATELALLYSFDQRKLAVWQTVFIIEEKLFFSSEN